MLDPYKVRDIYLKMELALISSLKRNLWRWINEIDKLGKTYEPWQIAKLRDIERFRKANRKIIGEYHSMIEKTIAELIHGRYLESYHWAQHETALQGDILDSLFPLDATQPKNEIPHPEEVFFHSNDERVNLVITNLIEDTRQVKTLIGRKMDDVYRTTINQTLVKLEHGAIDLRKAVDETTHKFLEKGIDAITYKNGAKVNVASYSEMALRSAFMQVKFLADGKRRDETNNHLVVSSIHANCCEQCLRWQGMVLIDDVFSAGKQSDGHYWLLSKAIEGGFLHPNCRHNIVTYIPGITRLPKPLTVFEERELLKRYKNEQIQRGLERDLRRQKRLVEGLFEPQKELSKLKMIRSALKDHVKRNPELRRDYWRERLI